MKARPELVVGIALALVLFVILARPVLHSIREDWALATRTIYVRYVDTFLVFLIAVLSISLLLTSYLAYRREHAPPLFWLVGVFALFSLKAVLTLLDLAVGGPKFWLVDTISHLLDFAILLLFALALLYG